ncbi:MAG: ferric reductase-like transmembrane domain-containing protein [Gammaproteobacteria bacterium]|uniref:ferredoxin reductase family protein n=1 Tax=Rhodoferax sp. TaxID=50421 RepID=UPI00183BBD1C|nr:ferric reductase-like transmembrane domain-containing protein [Rhodoferax sp.]MBU3898848.1 ferric reductase-like transmembrane domain-containing protein [Gammaproteobacteria bacterium]MBA3059470.1 oxidoreductase [Rhodoferax sp.]MBU3999039.1 ferric reductase-like transmembrane domain-containing protein [Gammaproteobacteria bacterium]MBU4019324.1 ferric reductase-like transmembrane domain-containing protein [Gammaproteobacteria bacterium]MBU4081888.1 ferric reductase-like transmembrane domain
MRNHSFGRAALWTGIYLLLVAAPLLVLLTGQVPAGAGFWWDFSMALGFAALAMFGVQFLLTARFRHAAAPFGIDIIYRFHRYAAVIAFGLLAAHFLILRVDYVETLGTIDPFVAPWYMSAGRAAFVLFALVIVSSLWRKPLHIDYDHWRMAHALLATLAFLAAVAHVEGVNYYTAAPWKRLLWTGYSLFWVGLILYVRLAKPFVMLRRPWRVAEVRPEGGKAWTLSLVPQGHAGMRFAAGQFAWLTLRVSPFQLREHPFSFSSSAVDGERVEFTIKELGDFSATIKTVQPGETAWLDGPYGVFSPDRHPHAPGFVLIAGGVGVAPMMSMLRTAADRGEARPYMLICANNRGEDILFGDELERLRARLDLTLVQVLAEPPEGWTGESGQVDRALLERRLPANRRDVEYFLCGPKPMTDAVQQALRALGVPLAQVHFELFDMV